MPRPSKCRHVSILPYITYFKPRGIPLFRLQENRLTIDELEAIRLADLETLSQEEAALQMNVSRATFGRILEKAHKIIADALINGKAILIEGGNYHTLQQNSQLRVQNQNCHICRKEEKNRKKYNKNK